MQELELLDGDKLINEINFGRPELGFISVKILNLKNNSEYWPIKNIKFENTDNDITLDYPKSLNAMESKEVKITWNPKFERREPLNLTLKYSGDIIIG